MENASNNKAEKVKWLVTLIITLGVYLIPTNDVYTRQMSLFFTVTVFGLLLMAFEFFEPLVVSVTIPMLWVGQVLLSACALGHIFWQMLWKKWDF